MNLFDAKHEVPLPTSLYAVFLKPHNEKLVRLDLAGVTRDDCMDMLFECAFGGAMERSDGVGILRFACRRDSEERIDVDVDTWLGDGEPCDARDVRDGELDVPLEQLRQYARAAVAAGKSYETDEPARLAALLQKMSIG